MKIKVMQRFLIDMIPSLKKLKNIYINIDFIDSKN